MHYPQIVVYEPDGRLAEQLHPLAKDRRPRWSLREPRQADVLWRYLRQYGPTVLVVHLVRHPERELALLERVGWQLPDVATVAVGDPEEADLLAGLAWDLGVSFALFPPISRDLLPGIVTGLMQRAIRDTLPGSSPPAECAAVTQELPSLDETRCTGCGDCVAVCPAACLEMAGPRPWLPRPGDCLSCTLCVLVCPAHALRMTALAGEE